MLRLRVPPGGVVSSRGTGCRCTRAAARPPPRYRSGLLAGSARRARCAGMRASGPASPPNTRQRRRAGRLRRPHPGCVPDLMRLPSRPASLLVHPTDAGRAAKVAAVRILDEQQRRFLAPLTPPNAGSSPPSSPDSTDGQRRDIDATMILRPFPMRPRTPSQPHQAESRRSASQPGEITLRDSGSWLVRRILPPICTPSTIRRRAAGAAPEWVIWMVVRHGARY